MSGISNLNKLVEPLVWDKSGCLVQAHLLPPEMFKHTWYYTGLPQIGTLILPNRVLTLKNEADMLLQLSCPKSEQDIKSKKAPSEEYKYNTSVPWAQEKEMATDRNVQIANVLNTVMGNGSSEDKTTATRKPDDKVLEICQVGNGFVVHQGRQQLGMQRDPADMKVFQKLGSPDYLEEGSLMEHVWRYFSGVNKA